MAQQIVVTKTAGGVLIPIDQSGIDYINKMKVGGAVKINTVRANNPRFHKKLMALFNLGFEAWEPGELKYKGQIVAKQFDQFRKDITILAGYYESSVNFKQEVRLTAKSLNFDSMEQDEREALYNAVINVLLERVLTHYSKPDLENVINQLMAFT